MPAQRTPNRKLKNVWLIKVVIAVLAVGVTVAGVVALDADDTAELLQPAQLTIHLDSAPTQPPANFAQPGAQPMPALARATPVVISEPLCDKPAAERRVRETLC